MLEVLGVDDARGRSSGLRESEGHGVNDMFSRLVIESARRTLDSMKASSSAEMKSGM